MAAGLISRLKQSDVARIGTVIAIDTMVGIGVSKGQTKVR
jgi:hypothetical protein